MCNRARNSYEPETLHAHFGTAFSTERPMDNRFNPSELIPRSRAYVIRETDRGRCLDVMSWDVLGGGAAWPMTNVRNLGLPQWRALAAKPENRCLVPLSEFCEWTPEVHDLGDGKTPEGRDVVSSNRSTYVRGRRLLAANGEGQWVHDGDV